MAGVKASSTARRMAGVVTATAMLAGVSGLSVSGQNKGPREWRDYAGGPDSSRFVAATEIDKTNVHRLQVAWIYPAGQTDFNPLVVRGVVYGLGAKGTFVALDAATGKEIWTHQGVQGFSGRGVNYWESPDGSDRRLIFSFEQLPAGDRRPDRPEHLRVRRRRPRRSARGAGPRSVDGQPAEPAAGAGLREPHHPWLGDESGVHVGAG